MYEYIKGKFMGISREYVTVDNNGIGYRIYTSGNTMAKMPEHGEEVQLYTSQVVRQDFIGLYGFSTKEELELFLLLTTVNGVGNKSALSLLSITNTMNLKKAIVAADEKLLLRAPGIGKKSAQRIILELKDKLSKEVHSVGPTKDNEILLTKDREEAQEALVALGYSIKEADSVLGELPKDLNLEDTIKEALKRLIGF